MTFLGVWWRVLLSTFRVLGGSYLLSSYGALFLHFFVGEAATDLTAFANSVMHITLLGAFPLIILSLILRQRGLALLAVPVAVVWLAWFGVYLTPRTVAPPVPSTPTLTVLTYNAFGSNRDVEAVEQIIRNADADIVALQELNTEVADHLDETLLDEYPYAALYPGGIPGSGVFSRYPIIEETMWQTQLKNQRLTVEFEGETVVIYNTHPVSPIGGMDGFARRHRDINRLLERAVPDAETYPVIVAGDFNVTVLADDYERIRQTFRDAYREAGDGLGFTYAIRSALPAARIDYVFYTAPFRAIDAQVIPELGGSDHFPLLVTFAWEPE